MKFSTELVALVKQKKELSPLDNSLVLEALESIEVSFDSEKYVTFSQFKRSKYCKELVSLARKKLRDVYGLFLTIPLTKKHLDRLPDIAAVDSLLSLHKSTQERAIYYESIYPLLFEELAKKGLKKDFILADLACGYNPLAYFYLPIKPSNYVVCDLSSQDMDLLQYFFDKFALSGRAHPYNLLGTSFYQFLETQKFDVCFLFKALDPLEQVKRNSSKKLLDALPTQFMVVSFSLFSIGGKVPIDVSKRSWFEKFCKKQGWEYSTLQIPNELFYVIKK